MSRPPAAAQVFYRYLPHTQNWIYEQLRQLRAYRPIALAYRAAHTERYPLDSISAVRSRNPIARLYQTAAYRALGYYPLFAHTVARQDARVLHAHFGETGVHALGLARRTRRPLLVSFYGLDLWRDHGRPERMRARYRALFEACVLALAEGPAARQRLIELGCPPERARIHRLGIDLSRLAYRPRGARDAVHFLMVGRFTEKKGFSYGVEAFCRAAAADDRLYLTVVGDAGRGAAEQAIKARMRGTVEKHGLQARVRFTGLIPPPEFHALLYEHDVLVQPSVRAANGDAEGGLPVTLIEAAASGLPLIGTRHCDIPDIVIPETTGWLCAERDVDALAGALRAAAEDADCRLRLGAQARALAEQRFDVRAWPLDPVYQEAERRPA